MGYLNPLLQFQYVTMNNYTELLVYLSMALVVYVVIKAAKIPVYQMGIPTLMLALAWPFVAFAMLVHLTSLLITHFFKH